MESRWLYPAKNCFDCTYPFSIRDEIKLPEGALQIDESGFPLMVGRIKAWGIQCLGNCDTGKIITFHFAFPDITKLYTETSFSNYTSFSKAKWMISRR